ncbi:methyltransferase domain-containing protein [Streptomyces sp. RB6PN25]|uniref:Protein-L-isoaspartate O-methyltransferase n=2 Tax=Streptomyces humicola TaxID=2953240 RepID=A0ABT1PZ96_9ACTN|nr:methyltransferase domain-containing protein [Streptomyces humicola]MCQ4081862.1 methyltransferase domain-containing protein [Streptomyces humicola]
MLTDPHWRRAFAEVPRHLFVPSYYRPGRSGRGHTLLTRDDPDPAGRARWLAGTYEDVPLITRLRAGALVSSSSQPSLMAMMLEALEVSEGQTVLEIGAGTGYNAALLAHRLGACAVTTVDLDGDIANAARERLAAAGYADVTVVTGDGTQGCPYRAPFDRIMATCELTSVPAPWLRQCRPGGLVIAPVAGGLVVLRVADAAHAEGRFLRTPAYFVALRRPGREPEVAQEPSREPDDAGTGGGQDERVRRTGTPPWVLDNDDFRFVMSLMLADTAVTRAFGGRGATLVAADGSRAHVGSDGSVRIHGPRDLWAGVERAHDLWQREGRPRRERFGLTVDGIRQRAWLDEPDGRYVWDLARSVTRGAA